MITVYILCLIYLVAAYAWLILVDVRRSRYQSASFVIVILATLGYIALIRSTVLREALLALKITYIAGCFLPVTFLFVIAEACAVNVPKWLEALALAFQGFIFIVVCGIGYNDLFYKGAELVTDARGNSYLVKDYGPLHALYLGTMYTYLACGFVLLVYTLRHESKVYKPYIRIMMTCSTLTILSYVVERMLHIPYDILPISFTILITGSLVPIYYTNMYTVTENRNIIEEQLEKVGFITFDRWNHYRGSNEFAKNIFAELKDYGIGQKMENVSPELEVIVSQVRLFDEKRRAGYKDGHVHTELKELHIGDRIFDASIHTINNFLDRFTGYTIELRDETEHYRALDLQNRYNEELAQKVEEQTEHIRSMQEQTILGMAQMVESRDLSTGGHIKRTSDVVRIFSEKLLTANIDLDKHFLSLVIRSAPMHDLGKISVDDNILRKQGRYTPEEYDIMKGHAAMGAEIVRKVLTNLQEEDFVQVAENVAHYHHEKYDGKGYPDGLKGEEIPIEARIMALADVFDALVSKRCYKDAYSYEKAYSIIEQDTGTHFDPVLAPIFLSCRQELEEYYNNSEH